MAAAGLDGGIAVHAGVEAWSEPDVERDVYRERVGSGLEQTRVDHYGKVKSEKKDVCIRIDDHRNFLPLQCRENLTSFNAPRRDPLDSVDSLIDRLSK
jgi:hypothetical protein